jgi:HEAT repeat protein
MTRLLKPIAAIALLTGLVALTIAPDAYGETKDAEAKKWTERLKSAKDSKSKAEAIEQVGKLAQINKKLGEAGLPTIKAALKDKDLEVRKQAALAFGRCDPDDSDAVSLLVDLLKNDKDEGVKQNAAMGLAALGSKATDAIPALRAASKATENKKLDRVYKDAMKSINGNPKKKG